MSEYQTTANPITTPTLVVLCKRPRLHQGKQRLAATLGAEAAFNIAQLLFDCALEDAKSWSGTVVLAPASSDDTDWAQALYPQAVVLPQPEGNLGQRINGIDQTLFEAGHQQRVYIGTDAPMHDTDLYEAAQSALHIAAVVLNRATDGGVTLMATVPPWPDLTDLAWSTETLGDELEALCRQQGYGIARITDCYDIDVEADLRQLQHDLENDTRPARQHLLSYLKSYSKSQVVD